MQNLWWYRVFTGIPGRHTSKMVSSPKTYKTLKHHYRTVYVAFTTWTNLNTTGSPCLRDFPKSHHPPSGQPNLRNKWANQSMSERDSHKWRIHPKQIPVKMISLWISQIINNQIHMMYIDLQNAKTCGDGCLFRFRSKMFLVLEIFYFPTGWLRLTMIVAKNCVAIQWSNGKVEWFTTLNLPTVGWNNPWSSEESLMQNPVPSHLLQNTFSGVPKWWLKQSELQACTCAFNLSNYIRSSEILAIAQQVQCRTFPILPATVGCISSASKIQSIHRLQLQHINVCIPDCFAKKQQQVMSLFLLFCCWWSSTNRHARQVYGPTATDGPHHGAISHVHIPFAFLSCWTLGNVP